MDDATNDQPAERTEVVPVLTSSAADDPAARPGGWRYELRRWLATLNPGRTPREYEKAVAYFFETPGVPAAVAEVSQDLLLAYRGALSLRATPHTHAQPATRPHVAAAKAPQLSASKGPALLTDGEEARAEGAGQPADTSPLAPATVNLRLTALRQFLAHCAVFGVITLPSERIRAALKRLAIERRRPYQVLAEPEWQSFLRAARAPGGRERQRHLTRAERISLERGEGSGELAQPQPRASRAGLTGARTAERDHALLALALATGLRAIEIAALDVGDLVREWHAGREEWWLVLPDAKTKGQRGGRTLPLSVTLVQTLFDYLAVTSRSWEVPADRATPLFLTVGKPLPRRRGARSRPRDEEPDPEERPGPHRLTPGAIRRIVDRVETQWLAERGGSGGRRGTVAISPHALRHSTAIALLEGNMTAGRPPASVEHVRGWLGHFDIRTTQGYLAHLEAREKKRPFKLDPLPPPQPPDETEPE
ncbi:MAG TPA: site-specific integrase [Ktedonobacterales bacterium]